MLTVDGALLFEQSLDLPRWLTQYDRAEAHGSVGVFTHGAFERALLHLEIGHSLLFHSFIEVLQE